MLVTFGAAREIHGGDPTHMTRWVSTTLVDLSITHTLEGDRQSLES